MKQLELNLKKRLLIVEVPRLADYEFINKDSKYLKIGDEEIKLNIPTLAKVELICKGSKLTEEIAKGLVKNEISDYLVEWAYDYKNEEKLNLDIFSCLESFISAIEAKGWKFGNNPYQNDLDKCNEYTDMFTIAKRTRAYEEYDFRNFNPDKTLIFEIL